MCVRRSKIRYHHKIISVEVLDIFMLDFRLEPSLNFGLSRSRCFGGRGSR